MGMARGRRVEEVATSEEKIMSTRYPATKTKTST